MVKKIIKYPSGTLRAPAVPVDFLHLPFGWSEYIRDLVDTLNSRPEGLAIASNQVCAEALRVFVTKPGVINFADEVFVNPTWEPVVDSGQLLISEACLSFPEMGWPMHRWQKIKVTYFAPDGGERRNFLLGGLSAQVFQHECDHLDGKLIVDGLPKREQLKVRTAMIRRKQSGHV